MLPYLRLLPFILSALIIALGLYFLGPHGDYFLTFMVVVPGFTFGLASVIATLGLGTLNWGKAIALVAISTAMHAAFWGGAYFTIGMAGIPLAALAGWLMALLITRFLNNLPTKGLGLVAIPGGLAWLGFYLGQAEFYQSFFTGYAIVYLLWQTLVGASILWLIHRSKAAEHQG